MRVDVPRSASEQEECRYPGRDGAWGRYGLHHCRHGWWHGHRSGACDRQACSRGGALTVGVVTKPFDFEGTRRRRAAEEGIARLRETVDALIVIPNQRLLDMVDAKTSIEEAFGMADDVLRQGIGGISDLIIKPGIINLDFADVKTVMKEAGSALMAIGHGSGETRCIDAAHSD